MIALLAQMPLPKDGDNPWIYITGALIFALGFVGRLYIATQTDSLKRERDQNDKLVNAIPEIVAIMREWKEANHGRPPTPRS